jgi:serine/threonine protein kinase
MSITIQWLSGKFPDLANLTALGSGGQKLVFSAEDPTDGPVVLKLIHPQQDVASVQREMLAVQQVQSRRVPAILDSGTIATPLGTCFWFRERRILGRTVRECLNQRPLDGCRVLKLGLHTLEALVKAEEARIVHRDVKPDNIICDQGDNFWLIDFGIARHLQLDSLTATAAVFGKLTWGYAPPEQCRNDKPNIDARADLFALGITLYESATGVNPFRQGARDALEILSRVERMPLPPLSLSLASASEVRDLVAAMTQKRRDHRPTTAAEALAWMQEICSKEQI